MATMAPPRSRASVEAIGSSWLATCWMSPSTCSLSFGPQSGQQVVSAWKRRSVGERYSLSQSRAQRKGREAGLRPVVGQAARDGVARAAVGAGDEGVAPASAGGIEQLGQAVGAGGHVGADGGARRPARAFGDREAAEALRRRLARAHGVHPGQRRRVRAQALDQRGDLRGRALGGDLHALRVVAHPAGEVQVHWPAATRTAGSRHPGRCRSRGFVGRRHGRSIR